MLLETLESARTSAERKGSTWAMMAFNLLAISVCIVHSVRGGGERETKEKNKHATISLTGYKRSKRFIILSPFGKLERQLERRSGNQRCSLFRTSTRGIADLKRAFHHPHYDSFRFGGSALSPEKEIRRQRESGENNRLNK